MARSIKDAEAPIRCPEVPRGHFNREASLLLLLCLVHEVGEFKASLVIHLRFLLILPQLMVCKDTILEEYLTGERTLATIDMTNDYKIQVLLFFLRRLDRLSIDLVLNFWVGRIKSLCVDKLNGDLGFLSGSHLLL